MLFSGLFHLIFCYMNNWCIIDILPQCKQASKRHVHLHWPKDNVFDLRRHYKQVTDSMTSHRLIKCFCRTMYTLAPYMYVIRDVIIWISACVLLFYDKIGLKSVSVSYHCTLIVNLAKITNYKLISWIHYETGTHYRSSIYTCI